MNASSSPRRVVALTALAMLAFAANSVLCRLALQQTSIDPARFTSIRLLSGALMLWLLLRLRGRASWGAGSWGSALALFAYAAGFSFAYVSLPTASGALLLFGAVQLTMMGAAWWRGERLNRMQGFGFVLACAGLAILLLPGWSAPPLAGATLMLGAGVAWGVYSLRGRGGGDPGPSTAGNFLRCVPLAVLLWSVGDFAGSEEIGIDPVGAAYAIASGALASGMGYAIWYAALPSLRASVAATVQLSVPVLAALGGVVFLGESLNLRLLLASMAILGGIALVVLRKTGA